MIYSKGNLKIVSAKNQLQLYGYEHYFNSFRKLYEKRRLPNSILLSGLKGSGKSTFVYHFINYLFSYDEEKRYSTKNFIIDSDNISYKLIKENSHPNFFLIENPLLEQEIKIDQIRDLLKFLNKSAYKKGLKIILIDNADRLNLNSSSALLKALEEPQDNTFFFINHNSASYILDTIKSRCTIFNFFFNISEKKYIFENIIKQYKKEFNIDDLIENLYFDAPGNLIKYFLSLDSENINISGDKLPCILYFIDKYKHKKDPETLNFLKLFIEKFYNELCLRNSKNVSSYLFNHSRISRQIDDMRKFNLNEKNVLIWVKDILQNETE